MNMLTNPFVMASAKGAAWLLVWSWQAAVLIACVWAGLKIFRVKSPALRHQVWLFALIAVAAMPILGGVVQNLPLPQPSHRALSYAVELPRIVVTNDAAPVVQNPSPAVRVKPSSKQPIILGLLFAPMVCGRARLRREGRDQWRKVTSLEGRRALRFPGRSRLRRMRLRGVAKRESGTRAFGRNSLADSARRVAPDDRIPRRHRRLDVSGGAMRDVAARTGARRAAGSLRQSLSNHPRRRLLFPPAGALRLPAIDAWRERWPAMIT